MRLLATLLISMLSFNAYCAAAAYRISPLKLEFDPARNGIRTKKLSLTNVGNEDVVVQITAFRWRQEDGRDSYEPTKDLFFAPPIVRIPAKSKKIIPIRFKGVQEAKLESSYRVYLEEQPRQLSDGISGTKFRTRFGIPVFVSARSPNRLDPNFSISRPTTNVVDVTINNVGSRRINVGSVYLFPKIMRTPEARSTPLAEAKASLNQSSYVLAGQSSTFRLQTEQAIDAEDSRVWIYTDLEQSNRNGNIPEGAFAVDFTVDGRVTAADIDATPSEIVPVEGGASETAEPVRSNPPQP